MISALAKMLASGAHRGENVIVDHYSFSVSGYPLFPLFFSSSPLLPCPITLVW
jgi:hypothetical protein